MFTGLIEAVCPVSSLSSVPGGAKLYVDLGTTGRDVKVGDSISVNGVCQTIIELDASRAGFDVSGQTLKRTTTGSLGASSQVNIERALAAADRFGGHFVQGHIDGTGSVKILRKQGSFWEVTFSVDKEILKYVVPKGSIAIDGVSLTVAEINSSGFSAAVIPQTWENTIFKNYRVGAKVNIETDILCRIIKQQLERILPDRTDITINKLKSLGF